MEEIQKIIDIIQSYKGSKGKPYQKPQIKYFRDKLNDLALPLMENQMQLVVGKYVLEKWYDPPSKKTRVMIFTRESWDRKENYNKLKWIK